MILKLLSGKYPMHIKRLLASNSTNDQLISGIFLILLASFGVLDFIVDLRNNAPLAHLISEASLSVLGFGWSIRVFLRVLSLRTRLKITEAALVESSESASHWKAHSSKLVSGLNTLILKQFEDWSLSLAEKDVAMLLLKGFSLKEIAGLRNSSERTVSQQSIAIYRKADVQGRAELSAFFFEDLLSPVEQI